MRGYKPGGSISALIGLALLISCTAPASPSTQSPSSHSISLSRSPALFQFVASAAIFSASSTSVFLRAMASPRAASRAARASQAFSSAMPAS